MKTISRRELLKKTAAGLGALTLVQWLSGFAPATGITNSTTAASLLHAVTADDLPYLAAATGGSDPEALVRKAVAAIGGMERFVPKGATVVVKPNMCIKAPASQGATTHPVVAAAVVKMALEAGAKKVLVMDFPFQGSSASVYEVCGVGPAVTAAGGEMVPISRIKFVTTQIPNAVRLKQAAIYDDILKAEVLINVPVAKSHSEAGVTLGMKNMMGTIDNRGELHGSLDQSIVDLNTIVHSHLTIIDAIRVMQRGGPTGGSPDYLKDFNTIVASADIVAADTYALRFFPNKKLEQIPYINIAAQTGLGRCDIENVKIEEISLA